MENRLNEPNSLLDSFASLSMKKNTQVKQEQICHRLLPWPLDADNSRLIVLSQQTPVPQLMNRGTFDTADQI